MTKTNNPQTDQSEKRRLCQVSCPMSRKAATLHQFTFTVNNYNYHPLSRRDTQLNNHNTLYMNSLKDY